jgi:hypothetical protein
MFRGYSVYKIGTILIYELQYKKEHQPTRTKPHTVNTPTKPQPSTDKFVEMSTDSVRFQQRQQISRKAIGYKIIFFVTNVITQHRLDIPWRVHQVEQTRQHNHARWQTRAVWSRTSELTIADCEIHKLLAELKLCLNQVPCFNLQVTLIVLGYVGTRWKLALHAGNLLRTGMTLCNNNTHVWLWFH